MQTSTFILFIAFILYPEELSRYSDGLLTGSPGFEFRQGRRTSLESVHSGFEAHRSSYKMATRDFFPQDKATGNISDFD